MKFLNLNKLKVIITHKSFFKLVTLFLVLFIVFKNLTNQTQQISSKQELIPIAKQLQLSTYTPSINVSGFIKPRDFGILKANFKAVVDKVIIQKGRFVKKGDLILELNNSEIEKRLTEAASRYDHKLAEYKSNENLSRKSFTSKNNYLASIADLKQAKANFQKAETDALELKVTAPDDGYLEECYVHVGDTVFAQDKLVNLIYPGPVHVRSYVSEEVIEKLSIGMQARINVANHDYMGQIYGLSRVADPDTRNFYIDLILENPNCLNYGVTAEVTLLLPQRQGFWINASALTLDDNGILGVKVLENSKVVFLPIKLTSITENGAYIEHDSSQLNLIAYGGEFLMQGQTPEVNWQKASSL